MKALLILGLALCAFGRNPGLYASLNEDSLNQILMVAFAFGLPELDTNFGNFFFEQDTWLGHIHFELENVKVSKITLDYENSKFTLTNPNKIGLALENISVSLSLEYHVKFGILSDHGNASVQMSGTNFNVEVEVGEDNYKPSLTVPSSKLNVGAIKVTTHFAVFNKLLEDLVNHMIKKLNSTLDDKIPAMIESMLPKVNAMFAGLNLNIPLGKTNLAADLNLDEGVTVIDNNVLVVALNGTLYDVETGEDVVLSPPGEMPQRSELPEPIQIIASDYMLNSAINAVWGMFSFDITKLPASLKMTLNTSDMALVIPQLKTTFGADKPVSIKLHSSSTAPEPKFWTDGQAHLNATFSMDFLVNATGEWTQGVTIDTRAGLVANVSVHNDEIHMAIDDLAFFEMQEQNSEIGKIDLTLIKAFLDVAAEAILPEVNKAVADIKWKLPPSIPLDIMADDVVLKTGYTEVGINMAL